MTTPTERTPLPDDLTTVPIPLRDDSTTVPIPLRDDSTTVPIPTPVPGSAAAAAPGPTATPTAAGAAALAPAAAAAADSSGTPLQHRLRPWHVAAAFVTALLLGGGAVAGAAALSGQVTGATAGTAGGNSAMSGTGGMSGMGKTGTQSGAAPAGKVATAGFPTGGPGIFTDRCAPTKTAADDPIMMPGMSGMSMQHDFFGNRAITASSTAASLVGGPTSCTTSADSSAYWTPVLYQKGVALKPRAALIYWRAPAQTAAAVKTMPAGISIIAGNEVATAPQDRRIIGWSCTQTRGESAKKVLPTSNSPHDCGQGSFLRLVISFPNCWDGHTLDGHEQKNVVYAGADGQSKTPCPASHPVQIPQIIFHVTYPTSSAADLTLSIGPDQVGPTVTGHADFLNGWNQPVLDADVAACIPTQTRCGPVTGAAAVPQGGRKRDEG